MSITTTRPAVVPTKAYPLVVPDNERHEMDSVIPVLEGAATTLSHTRVDAFRVDSDEEEVLLLRASEAEAALAL